MGNGSFDTQTRVIALPVNNVTIINNGKINVDVEKASTVRVLATTGIGGTIANYGSIKINSTGRIMTIARLANTHLINAGDIDIVSRAHFIVNKVSFLFQSIRWRVLFMNIACRIPSLFLLWSIRVR